MAEICCGVVSENEASAPCERNSRAARRRRMEIRKVKFVTGLTTENGLKRQKLELYPASFSRECDNAVENCDLNGEKAELEMEKKDITLPEKSIFYSDEIPKFGHASVCGRRRDMEDAVAIHPWFCGKEKGDSSELHYFGVYDGHGCSHVCFNDYEIFV